MTAASHLIYQLVYKHISIAAFDRAYEIDVRYKNIRYIMLRHLVYSDRSEFRSYISSLDGRDACWLRQIIIINIPDDIYLYLLEKIKSIRRKNLLFESRAATEKLLDYNEGPEPCYCWEHTFFRCCNRRY